jgi:hypothetical protein
MWLRNSTACDEIISINSTQLNSTQLNSTQLNPAHSNRDIYKHAQRSVPLIDYFFVHLDGD